MPLWIKFLQASSQHRDRLPIDIQRSLMGGTVDPQSQAAGDHKSTLCQVPGKGGSSVQCRGRCAATADDRQLWFFQQSRVASDKQQGWRGIHFRQQAGVGRIIPHQQMLVATL
ncbi:hypothetical protein D3C78_1250860 [compost metagenome]